MRRLFAAIDRLQYYDYFTFVTTDGWGRSADNFYPYEHIARGGLFIEYTTTTVLGFEQYSRDHIDNFSGAETPWTTEYLRCEGTNSTQCILDQLYDDFSHSNSVSTIIDAVYVFAHAYHAFLQEKCNSTDVPDEVACYREKLANLSMDVILEKLLNTSFDGTTGHIKFTKSGDYLGKYILRNLQDVNGSHKLVQVGEWDSQATERLLLNEENIQWISGYGGDGSAPPSVCSEACAPKHTIITLDTCCWGCFRCQDNEITVNNKTECQRCGRHQWPNDDGTECEPIVATYLQWSDPRSVMLSTLCSVGLLLSVLTIVGYIRHREHFLIKASSRELSAILLVGVVMCYVTSLVLLAKPSKPTCCVVRITYMLCFTLIYSPALTKAIRIFRIFTRSHKSVKSLKGTSATSQLIITTLFFLPQIILSAVWIAIVPPEATPLMPSAMEKRLELTCNLNQGEMISSLVYNLLLILVCCFFAFKTRKVPDNYNESRFITLSVYTTLVIWLAFIPTYFTTHLSTTKILLLDLALILNSSLTLLCLFAPKFYAIYFVKNVVKPSMTTMARSMDQPSSFHPAAAGTSRAFGADSGSSSAESIVQ
ncbi:metabotropic glutamate receptor 2-like [Ptychodera flava]|uniref:metabotropic glutamate receptor 2-like n=1 Tax=Ptychodera flava TaxID=63121 RepID=UPI003969E503